MDKKLQQNNDIQFGKLPLEILFEDEDLLSNMQVEPDKFKN